MKTNAISFIEAVFRTRVMAKEQYTAKFFNGEQWLRKWIAIQWNMYKNNTSVSIQERAVAHLNCLYCLTRSVVPWSCFELILWMNNDRKITLTLEKFYSKTHKLILKSTLRNTHCIVDPFTKIKSAGHMAKFDIKSISNRGTFCGFSFTSKCRKRSPWNR